MFSGDTLVNDYFNIDRNFAMHLRDYKEYIEKSDFYYGQNFNFLNLPGEMPSFSVKKYIKFDSLLNPVS